jgi:hypothetical protein
MALSNRPNARNGSTIGKKANGIGTLRTVRVAEIEAEPIDWLRMSRLARGKLTLIAGEQWPDGGIAPAGNVTMLSAEDAVKDVLRPRFEVAGADLDRVHVVEAAVENGKGRTFNLAADLERLRC